MKGKLPAPRRPLNSLARALVRAGVLTEQQVQAHCQTAQHTPGRLAAVLVHADVMNATALAEFASQQLGYPQLDLDALDVARLPLEMLNDTLRESQAVLPLSCQAGRLTVAMADPTDIELLDTLKHAADMAVDVVVVDTHQLAKALANAKV